MLAINQKRQLFERICQNITVKRKRTLNLSRVCCPCCGYPTLVAKSRNEICRLCDWQDDGEDDATEQAQPYVGGANGAFTLAQARANAMAHGSMYGTKPPSFAGQTTPQSQKLKAELVACYNSLLRAQPQNYPSIWQQALGLEQQLSKEAEKILKKSYAQRLQAPKP